MIDQIPNQKVQFTTPQSVLKKEGALETVNRYTLITPEVEMKSTEVDFKLFTLQKSTLWFVAKKVVVVASLAIAFGAVFTAALLAPHLVFPVMFGIGILYYKLHPKVMHPLETNFHKAELKRSNLEGLVNKQKELEKETKAELKKRFEDLNINIENYRIDPKGQKTISEDEALTLLVPLLARFEHWKDMIDETEKVQNSMLGRIEEIRERIRSDDDYSLTQEEALELETLISDSYEKLKKLSALEESEENTKEMNELRETILESENKRKLSEIEHSELIKELISLTYKVEDLDEDDALNFKLNSRLLSSIKAAYTLSIMQDLTQTKMISEFGHFNSHLKHVREALEGTSSGDDYFISNDGPNISIKDLKENVRDFDYIKDRMFQAKTLAEETTEEPA